MPWQFLIPAAAALIGGRMASKGAQSAAETSAAAADRAAELQRESAREALALQQRMYEEGVARQQPYYEIGVNALRQLPGRTGTMPAAFQYRPEQLTQDPGYQFRLQEGLKALERSAAARGGLMSGATGKALTRYGQEAASQEYSNAYNRALTEYNAAKAREAEEYNRLSGLAGTGGTTAQQIGAAGEAYGSRAGNLLTGTAANIGNIGMGQAQIAAQAAIERGSAYGGAANRLADIAGRYYGSRGTPAVGGFYMGQGRAGINPASGEYFGSLEF